MVSLGRRKGGEVVRSDQCLGARLQRRPFERVGPVQGATVLVCTACRARQQAVAVRAAGRVSARVEARLGLDAFDHGDVVWQQRVDRARPGGPTLVARHLAACVDARIRASGDRQRDRRITENDGERAFELLLDGPLAGLTRPAGKVRPAVLNCQARRQRRRPVAQTSSSSTISVESDRRGPSFRIRV